MPVSQLFPARLRGTALGFAAGVGRLGAIVGPAVTGTLVAANIAYPAGFYVFAAAGLLAVAALFLVPHQVKAADTSRAVPPLARLSRTRDSSPGLTAQDFRIQWPGT